MELTAAQTAEQVRTGSCTARQVVEAALQRIEDLDGRIGAFQEVRVFTALREADAVDARPDRAGLALAGVPIAVKDNVSVAGEPMRIGSRGTDPTPQQRDHEVVRRLRAAGAVIVGLTRVPELCVFATTDSAFGTTHNPWDLRRTPGGSSGGSAAAVASGMVPIAHGNDGMGSLRIPAACCGLVALKPGRGVVPAELGNGSWFGMAENGPLATTVDDAALMLSVFAEKSALADVLVPGGVRIAVSTAIPGAAIGAPLDRHWAAVTRETADLLGEVGHDVVPADPPYGHLLMLAEGVYWSAGTERDLELVPDRSALAPRTRRQAALGRAARRLGLLHAGSRTRWRDRAERFFAHHDVLLTPALAQPPPLARTWSERGWLANVWTNTRYAPFAAPWNLAGWPAMTVPAGLDPRGLPLAIQLVAPPGGEATLLGVAAQLERLRPWPHTATPVRSEAS